MLPSFEPRSSDPPQDFFHGLDPLLGQGITYQLRFAGRRVRFADNETSWRDWQ